jgi:4-carboxymuconolactone decarboxylase
MRPLRIIARSLTMEFAVRLSPVAREQLPEDQRRFFDAVRAIRRRPISGPFIVTMNSSPDLASRFAHLGHYFHARGQADESILSARVRTFIALVGSRLLNVPYEWNAWVGWALEAGVPQETADAIREGREPAHLTPEERLARDVCTQLAGGNHHVSDATHQAALAQFGAQGLVELVVCFGYFMMIAFPLNAFEIEMSAEQKAQRKPFEPLRVPPHPGRVAQRAQLPAFVSPRQGAAARIAAITRHEDLKHADQHYLDRIMRTRGHVSPIFQALLHTPDVADRIATVGAFFLYETALPPALRTLVWLVTAREFDSAYAWQASVPFAHDAGLTPALIGALQDGTAPPQPGDEQTTIIAFCHELLRGNHHVCDATYDRTISRFGVAATVQIAAALGYIAMMSCVANAFEITPATADAGPAL